jgi:hypothetical protein
MVAAHGGFDPLIDACVILDAVNEPVLAGDAAWRSIMSQKSRGVLLPAFKAPSNPRFFLHYQRGAVFPCI